MANAPMIGRRTWIKVRSATKILVGGSKRKTKRREQRSVQRALEKIEDD